VSDTSAVTFEAIRPVDRARAEDPAEPARTADRLAALFDAHHAALYRLARRMVADAEEARDLAQEAFLRAARSARSVPADDAGARAWLMRVVVNLCRDRRRRLEVRRRAADTVLRPDATGESPESGPESRAVARSAVQAALATLPPRRRAVVVLHELDGRPVAEIARLLRIARVTVRWHLAAGRKDLAAHLLSGGSHEG
jgi:RNA polymerase sigma-70 factor (ECF subfamily)